MNNQCGIVVITEVNNKLHKELLWGPDATHYLKEIPAPKKDHYFIAKVKRKLDKYSLMFIMYA